MIRSDHFSGDCAAGKHNQCSGTCVSPDCSVPCSCDCHDVKAIERDDVPQEDQFL